MSVRSVEQSSHLESPQGSWLSSKWWPVTGLAAVWVIGFISWLYFRLDLPNQSQLSRTQVLLYADSLLGDLIFPHGEPGENVGWGNLLQRLDLAWVAALILTASWSLGRLVLRSLRLIPVLTGAECFVFACGVGLSLWSLVTLGCGLAGVMGRSFHLGLIVTVVLVEGVCWWQSARLPLNSRAANSLPKATRPIWIENIQFWRRVTLAACVPFLFCIVFGGLLPQVDFDVKEYHFGGPKEWFQAGRMTFLPHNVYTSFPFLTEMFILDGMILKQDWYWGAIAGNGVLLCFAPLTALGLYCAGKRWYGEPAGLLAAWLHLSTPWVFRISNIAYTEGALLFFLFASLYATLLIWDVQRTAAGTDRAIPPRHSLPLLAGLLSGSAMACKYPGVISVVIPLGSMILLGPWISRWMCVNSENPASEPTQKGSWLDGRAVIIFSLGAALTVGPWLVKNLAQTGNPVYPLLFKVFGGKDWDAELDAKFKSGHSPNGYDLSEIPGRILDVAARDNWQSPLLFSLAPLALLNRVNRRRTLLLWLYVVYLFLTWWVFTHRIDRFWLPLIPVVSLLAGVGGTWVLGSVAPVKILVRRIWMAFLLATCLAMGLFLLAYIGGSPGLCGYNPFFLDLDQVARNTARITSPEIVELNEKLPPGSKVLCVGEAEIFDARFPLVYNTVFDKSIFEEWCGESNVEYASATRPFKSTEEIRRVFAEHGITHVYVNWLEILRYRTSYRYTDFATPGRFADLQQKGVLNRPWAIPQAFVDWRTVSYEYREEVKKWGPALKVRFADGDRLKTFDVFPIK